MLNLLARDSLGTSWLVVKEARGLAVVQYCRPDSIGKPHVFHRKTCMELI